MIVAFGNSREHVIWIRNHVTISKIKWSIIGIVFWPSILYIVGMQLVLGMTPFSSNNCSNSSRHTFYKVLACLCCNLIKKAIGCKVRKRDRTSETGMRKWRRCERERWAQGGCNSDGMWKCSRRKTDDIERLSIARSYSPNAIKAVEHYQVTPTCEMKRKL
jgi:hypothetical protein